MAWQALIDRAGEPGTLAATGLVIGIVFGSLAQAMPGAPAAA